MSLLDLILSRRSIRSYKKKEIPEDVLKQILEAGRQAPSAGNRQPIRFIVVKDPDVLKNLCDKLINRFVKYAPVAVVGCANVKSLLTGRWAVVDTTIAMQNMVIAAWTFGIGSCWVGACNKETVKKLLSVPDKWKFVALLTLGYPLSNRSQEKRNNMRNCLISTVFKANVHRLTFFYGKLFCCLKVMMSQFLIIFSKLTERILLSSERIAMGN